jgi:hypothetical protein
MTDLPAPVPGCVPVGRTDNTRYYRLDPDVLFVLPEPGLRDDGPSAVMNANFQIKYARDLGRRVAVVVHLTSLAGQDAEARRVYSERMEATLFYAAALVAGRPISRAIASFFLGLTKPKFPTSVHPSFDTALDWIAKVRVAESAH